MTTLLLLLPFCTFIFSRYLTPIRWFVRSLARKMVIRGFLPLSSLSLLARVRSLRICISFLPSKLRPRLSFALQRYCCCTSFVG
ncbi:hypothetical protein BKA65DRAFT_509737 [Rhexocercosporidium sp. MPI-PUGE-AT-0058]|nr:hypothetical protein BKA65DRAFT_509737 [Rhexocercosporidium sp. MPI-PUGE-AT-0058]